MKATSSTTTVLDLGELGTEDHLAVVVSQGSETDVVMVRLPAPAMSFEDLCRVVAGVRARILDPGVPSETTTGICPDHGFFPDYVAGHFRTCPTCSDEARQRAQAARPNATPAELAATDAEVAL